MKMFYFMDRSDFIANFLEAADEELDQPKSQVSKIKLQNLFEISLKTSSTSQLVIDEDIHLELDNKSLADYLKKNNEIGKRVSTQFNHSYSNSSSFIMSPINRNLLLSDTSDEYTKGKTQILKGNIQLIYIGI